MNLESFKKWLDAYEQAWENQDQLAATNIFAASATYQETPFYKQVCGRKAISRHRSEEPLMPGEKKAEVKFSYEILAVSENKGIARWQAHLARLHSKTKVKFDGIFVVYLNAENLCTAFEEWWNREEKQPQ